MYLFVQVCSLLLCCRKSEDTAKGCVDIFFTETFHTYSKNLPYEIKKNVVSSFWWKKLNNTKQNKKGMIVCAYSMKYTTRTLEYYYHKISLYVP